MGTRTKPKRSIIIKGFRPMRSTNLPAQDWNSMVVAPCNTVNEAISSIEAFNTRIRVMEKSGQEIAMKKPYTVLTRQYREKSGLVLICLAISETLKERFSLVLPERGCSFTISITNEDAVPHTRAMKSGRKKISCQVPVIT